MWCHPDPALSDTAQASSVVGKFVAIGLLTAVRL